MKLSKHNYSRVLAGATLMMAGLASVAQADVKLPGIISENMVLQQQAPIHLWGWADVGEAVTVTLQGQTATATTQGGKWSVTLPPQVAGGPYHLTIAGKNRIEFNNILVGEVWVCAGQSNMELNLRASLDGDKHVAAATNARIRLLTVKRTVADKPLDNTVARWQECSPQTVGGFSAVGYFFGRDLEKARDVPVGLIETDRGGTTIEAWTRVSALSADPALQPALDAYATEKAQYDKDLAVYQVTVPTAPSVDNTTKTKPPRRPWQPGELYNAMLAPLLPLRIRGVVWYQGESNGGSADLYRGLLPTLIRNWRADWNEGDFPFLLVQLPAFHDPEPAPTLIGRWPRVREAQLLATKTLPNVGLVVTTDVGERHNIHPKHKEPVGARLALLARHMVYGENIVGSGPVYRSMQVNGNQVTLRFDEVGSGLAAHPLDTAGNQVPVGKLVGFAVAGADGQFAWADAHITGQDEIVVSSPTVQVPVAVRFGWAEYPVVNLWNKEGLPASPFRTDAAIPAAG